MTARTLRHDATVRFALEATRWLVLPANDGGQTWEPEAREQRQA